jgi:hypothetical protein
MLTQIIRNNYIAYAKAYANGTRFLNGSPEFSLIVQSERLSPAETQILRNANGVYVDSLTITESIQQPRGGEQFFNVSSQPTELNVGLPAGTTPTANTTTTTTTATSQTSFLSKYKMPLIIGGVGIIAYLMFKKK